MTLITYPTRVHFADDVLQEALHSELERSGCKAPLLVSEASLLESEFADRILSGLPVSSRPQQLTFSHHSDLRQAAKTAIEQPYIPDVIIAFGSARAIEVGRKCRYKLMQAHGKRPLLFAVPGVDGLPGPCTRNLETWRSGLPSVLICDPTVALGVETVQLWRSIILSLVRCIESYLAVAYNPTADGMALDALIRCVSNFPKIDKNQELNLLRELMAASLNAALSQEKGVGPTLTLAAALADPRAGIEEPELAHAIFPSAIKFASLNGEKVETLLKLMGAPDQSLEVALTRLMAPVPFSKNLSDLGVAPEILDSIAHRVDGQAGLTNEMIHKVLDPIF
ncbi:iron-containing alcohol dehydrogenase [Falsihalocynthiibacter sp. S25ZX9]|uniref:iron-containing alcohol dehydrogenase n=1 Tax=Falsihalocynthiibacter sp. S25ZX9 TaxID=3240870 RepID=UPI0035100985